jgi:hypothetical protein
MISLRFSASVRGASAGIVSAPSGVQLNCGFDASATPPAPTTWSMLEYHPSQFVQTYNEDKSQE